MFTMLDKFKKAVYELLREDGRHHKPNVITDYIISMAICLNVALIVFESFDSSVQYAGVIALLRTGFFVFFLTEYILRVWIADIPTHDKEYPFIARLKYMFTPTAIINFLALLPTVLGSVNVLVDFRIFRILRLLRITQLRSVKRYTDIVIKVVKLKGAQLLASLFIVFIFLMVTSVVIYDFEHAAQPEVFNNILSCLWWSISAFTTVGYGDMYPVTAAGKMFGACMSVFGVFLMALPIGILTSGFFELSKAIDYKKRRE